MEDTIVNHQRSDKELLMKIAEALRDIRYGYVQITVHDSTVVQIDKNEKISFDRQNSFKTEGGDIKKK